MNLISDEMLELFATIGTYDELAPKLRERWGGLCSTMFLGLPPQLAGDDALMGGLVEALHQA